MNQPSDSITGLPICPQCKEAATFRDRSGTFWCALAHYWRLAEPEAEVTPRPAPEHVNGFATWQKAVDLVFDEINAQYPHMPSDAIMREVWKDERVKQLEESAVRDAKQAVRVPAEPPAREPFMEYGVAKDKGLMNAWRVEAIDTERDGEVYVTIFSGPDAEERANEYAEWKNGAVNVLYAQLASLRAQLAQGEGHAAAHDLLEDVLESLGWKRDEEAEEHLRGKQWARIGEEGGAWPTVDAVTKALEDYDALRRAHKNAQLFGANQQSRAEKAEAALAQAQQERDTEDLHLGSAKVRVRKMLDKPATDTQALAPMLSQLEAKLKRLTAAESKLSQTEAALRIALEYNSDPLDSPAQNEKNITAAIQYCMALALDKIKTRAAQESAAKERKND